MRTERDQQDGTDRDAIRRARVLLRHAQEYLEFAQGGALLPEQAEGVRLLIAEIREYLAEPSA